MNNSDYITFRDPGLPGNGYHEVTEATSSTSTAMRGRTLTSVTVSSHEEIQASTTEEVILDEEEKNGHKEKGTKVTRVRKAVFKDLIIKVNYISNVMLRF